ncbi:uncharacterized protein K452DRAFT_217516 [Aplosporella prunicola CBS 121167]|uniref:Clock-controlled protein 6 n=1 Tax=Aplosporella prunicola CBS 121167 TaxID=1176127 RepID=A0A6A6BVB9_9PEZI|nr:uncharacterized protein K452DRAFT_217516 [Aplosporella prunicola CBS 121167]KAF2147273.1 hypothetical protein K452DRAFT_217516 [Aplosporella prunicola CBS 121167]
MRFSAIAAAAALTIDVSAQNDTAPASYVTEVLTAYTTYCPEPTEIAHNGKTYTVTEASTLTITDCPCTVSKPVFTSVVTSCASCASDTPGSPAVPTSSGIVISDASSWPAPTSKPVLPTGGNGTASFSKPGLPSASGPASVPGSPASGTSGSGASTPVTTPPTFTGAASKVFAASGAGLAAVFGFAAYLL